MKLLMIYADRFAWRTAEKGLETAGEVSEERCLEGVLVGLIHAEAQDEAEASRVETKLVKNLKWGARKNETERIVLHSFSHLAETKAQPEFTKALLDRAVARLQSAGYETWQTPFGWFLDLDLAAPGRSTARIFAGF
jgi:hypothetical protein